MAAPDRSCAILIATIPGLYKSSENGALQGSECRPTLCAREVVHLIMLLARLLRPDGYRAIVAEPLLEHRFEQYPLAR